ncbi:hypothetical protein C5167_021384 [Papaver somniferum]|uniref:Serine aminopeptidase S33 domain-containing protein n=1 Tax=Papaver somniferum TaxID=3469 RepID=A0A4Y7IWE2_PAPSO|nr:hypothetical protein C5167_021384 [Papaver somniferum]
MAAQSSSVIVEEQTVIVKNKYGENLVGILHETGSTKVVILCHGFRSHKVSGINTNLAEALTRQELVYSGLIFLGQGIAERLGKDYMERIEKDGFIDVKGKDGNFQYRLMKESLMERRAIDMGALCLSIGKDCRVLIVHGYADKIVPVADAHEFAKVIANHK